MGTPLALPIVVTLRLLRAFVRTPATIAPVLLGLAISSTSCGSLPTQDQVNRDLYGNLETAAASPDRNYDVYWLGRSFEAGGLTFVGPEANAPADSGGLGAGIGGVEGGGLEMSYTTKGCCSGIDITLYSRQAWEPFVARSVQPNQRKKTVQLNGQTVELWTSDYSPGKIAARTLVIDYGRTVVTAVTGSVVPKTPGPEPNPLIDETTFLAAMQNLRPYPQ